MTVLLSLRDVRVGLCGREVLNGVSLQVGAGEIVALLGPNGAGKTTLLRTGLGLAPLASGEVLLGGLAPHGLSARGRALRAAYLPQRPQSIWPIRVDALVALGRYAHGGIPDRLGPRDRAAVDAAIQACALGGLRTRRMDELSGGEKARAHLARALAQETPLLLLDEPTAGLDPAQSLAVADILRARAAAGAGILFSTHDVSLAAATAQRVLLMRDGAPLAEGSPLSALTPATLESAYARRGRLERVGETFAAIFE